MMIWRPNDKYIQIDGDEDYGSAGEPCVLIPANDGGKAVLSIVRALIEALEDGPFHTLELQVLGKFSTVPKEEE